MKINMRIPSHRNACAFLPPMLKSVKPEVGKPGGFGLIMYSENAAGLFWPVVGVFLKIHINTYLLWYCDSVESAEQSGLYLLMLKSPCTWLLRRLWWLHRGY